MYKRVWWIRPSASSSGRVMIFSPLRIFRRVSAYMVHAVQMGKRTRMSFSKIEEVLEMPNLIEVQKNSYARFLNEDLLEVLKDISPITDFSDKYALYSKASSLRSRRIPKKSARSATIPTPEGSTFTPSSSTRRPASGPCRCPARKKRASSWPNCRR